MRSLKLRKNDKIILKSAFGQEVILTIENIYSKDEFIILEPLEDASKILINKKYIRNVIRRSK